MCGLFGVRSPERDVARLTYFGLFALQHRGQESAGIAVSDSGRLTTLRDMGLVTQVFDEQKLRGLHGDVAIGHTRYSTTGSSQWANAQPLLHHGRVRTVAVGHNGNLINVDGLREEITASGPSSRRRPTPSSSAASAIPSIARASSQPISGFSGLPKLRQSVRPIGSPPAQATFSAAP